MLDTEQKKIFSKNLNNLIAASGKTQKEIADAIHVSPQTFNTWSKGIALPRMGKVQALADYFHIKKSDLIEAPAAPSAEVSIISPEEFERLGLKHIKKFVTPLLGTIACGTPIYADEHVEGYVCCDMDVKSDFCLFAKGDSMINAGIHDGDVIFIKKCSTVDNGTIAAVCIDDEATLKRVYYDEKNQVLTLVAENPAYPPMVYTAEDAKNVVILGKAMFFIGWIK